jgi:glucans biosynthesis protein C
MMNIEQRRYDIDWLRVVAIGLLLVYHVAIAFQPWGIMIGFITTDRPWLGLWAPMALLNVWRIPLLFFVSGMGVWLAMRKRSWAALMQERSLRIMLPYVFGAAVVFPLSSLMWQRYNGFDLSYHVNPGHLWFLGNIFAYVLLLSPVFFYVKDHEGSAVARAIRWLLGNPLGLLVLVACSVAEALLVMPNPYEMYAMTWHGFFLGLVAFFFGFCFMHAGDPFWGMMLRWRWIFLPAAAVMFAVRLHYFGLRTPPYLVAIESDCWIFAALGFGHRYLNKPGKVLSYLSQAVYPIYIIHLIIMFAGSWLIFKWNVPPPLQFVLLVVFTISVCLVVYEFVIRRSGFIRLLFGLKQPGRHSVD